jgi:hypothetical protein
MRMEKYTPKVHVFSCARNIQLLALNMQFYGLHVNSIFPESYDFTASCHHKYYLSTYETCLTYFTEEVEKQGI